MLNNIIELLAKASTSPVSVFYDYEIKNDSLPTDDLTFLKWSTIDLSFDVKNKTVSITFIEFDETGFYKFLNNMCGVTDYKILVKRLYFNNFNEQSKYPHLLFKSGLVKEHNVISDKATGYQTHKITFKFGSLDTRYEEVINY